MLSGEEAVACLRHRDWLSAPYRLKSVVCAGGGDRQVRFTTGPAETSEGMMTVFQWDNMITSRTWEEEKEDEIPGKVCKEASVRMYAGDRSGEMR